MTSRGIELLFIAVRWTADGRLRRRSAARPQAAARVQVRTHGQGQEVRQRRHVDDRHLRVVADVTEQWVGGVDFKLVVLQQRCQGDEQLFLCYGLSGT